MTTGPEHYRRAEQLLREVRDGHQEGSDVAAILTAAQVHATLAQAAATALNDNAHDEGGMPLEDFDEWRKAASAWQPKPKAGDSSPEESARATVRMAAAQLLSRAVAAREVRSGKQAAALLDAHGYTAEAALIQRAVIDNHGLMSAKQAAALLAEAADDGEQR